MHPVVANSDSELEGKTEYEQNNYTISYELVDCGYPDCSLEYGEVEHLDPLGQIFIMGLFRYAPEVIEMNKNRAERRKRIKSLKMAKAYLQVMKMTDMLLYPEDYLHDDDDSSSSSSDTAAVPAP